MSERRQLAGRIYEVRRLPLHSMACWICQPPPTRSRNVKTLIQLNVIRLACVAAVLLASGFSQAAEWVVPMAGNTFRTAPEPGGNGVRRSGMVAWSNPDEVFSVYFHVDRPADLRLQIKAAARNGRSELQKGSGTAKGVRSHSLVSLGGGECFRVRDGRHCGGARRLCRKGNPGGHSCAEH